LEKPKPIILGFGESDDPLPEAPQLTRYRVFAGPCARCGCAGRKLLVEGSELVLVCDNCGDRQATSLRSEELHEVTYVYWCNGSKFSSDEVLLSESDSRAIDALVKNFAEEYEAPHWAVIVVGGRCTKSGLCIKFDCPYLLKSQ
jgi:hypothetical protein